MRLTDVRALLGGHLAGRPTRANFRTGTLTVCTMVPMRSVPHRVVCLLGLDDGVFPRLGLVDGDDVLARDPVTGERDVRSEDRQLLLDAIGAATERLVVTYTGANEHSGQQRPPAVPLGELLDALDRTTEAPGPRRGSWSSTRCSRSTSRTSSPAGSACPTPFTFDPTDAGRRRGRDRARGRRRRRSSPSRCRPSPTGDDVALADLLAFFRDPVKGFFRALDLTLPWDVDGVSDAMPVEIDAPRDVGRRRPDARRHAARASTPTQALAAEWRRGSLPPGQLGLAQGQRGPRARRCSSRSRALTHRQVAPEGLRRRRRPRRRSPPHRHRHPASTATGWSRSATPGSTASTCWTSWIRLLALAADHARPQLDRADDRPAAARHQAGRSGCSGPPATEPLARCSPTSSRSTTRVAASRCRCRSRRRSRGPAPGTDGDEPLEAAAQEVAVRQVPRRGRRPRPRPGLGSARAARDAARAGASRRGVDGRAHPARRATPRGCGCRCSRCEQGAP